MRRIIFTLIVAMFFGIGSAFAQEPGAGAGRVEIGAFPGGGMFFTKSTDATQLDFGKLGIPLTQAAPISCAAGRAGAEHA